MIEIDKWLMQKKSKTKMIMQVHDELVFEIHEDDIKSRSKKYC
jgi:DNA polymerase-1